MGGKVDPMRKKYGPLKDKTMRNALAHRIGTEFPRRGGARVLGLRARLITAWRRWIATSDNSTGCGTAAVKGCQRRRRPTH